MHAHGQERTTGGVVRGVFRRARPNGGSEIRLVASDGDELLIIAGPRFDPAEMCRRARRYLDEVDPVPGGAEPALPPLLRLHTA